MTIEATLERIATALEIIALGKGTPPTDGAEVQTPLPLPVAAVAPKRGRPPKDPSASTAATAAPPASKPAQAAVPTTSSKATTTASTAAEPSSGLTKEDLRVALNGLQKATSVDDVKRLLASFKAQTLSQVPEDKYAAVIERAKAMVEAAAAEPAADPKADPEADPFA